MDGVHPGQPVHAGRCWRGTELQAAGVSLPHVREQLATEPLPLTDLAIACVLSGLGHVVMRLQVRLQP